MFNKRKDISTKQMNPYIKYTVWALLGAGIIGLPLSLGLKVQWFFAYIIAINFVTYLMFWYDKSIASDGNKTRIPEFILHSLSFAGGPFASLAAQKILRHKTQKLKFQLIPFLALAHHVGTYLYHQGYFS